MITTVPIASPMCRETPWCKHVPRVQAEPGAHLQGAGQAVENRPM